LVRVVAPISGTPAARAGLQSGDLIVGFDDQPVQGMALADAISRMRGKPGTPITLMIRRAGHGGEFSVSLMRETIRTEALRWSTEGEVLVLRLARFTGSVPAAMEKAIAEATAIRQPRGVVLDMRGNAGGLFRQAVMMADAFLGEGEIVSLRARAANRRTWQADPVELLAGVPMVVLIDGRSRRLRTYAAALQNTAQRSWGSAAGAAASSPSSRCADKGALRLTTALYRVRRDEVQSTGVGRHRARGRAWKHCGQPAPRSRSSTGAAGSGRAAAAEGACGAVALCGRANERRSGARLCACFSRRRRDRHFSRSDRVRGAALCALIAGQC
jgi:carboxyl-terminal processing protease